jgi:hypothetical protein
MKTNDEIIMELKRQIAENQEYADEQDQVNGGLDSKIDEQKDILRGKDEEIMELKQRIKALADEAQEMREIVD